MFKQGINWLAGKDSTLFFWYDKWMNEEPIRNVTKGPLNKGEDNLLLKDVVCLNSWNWDWLSFVFPPPLLQKIKATPFPLSATRVDWISWHSSPNGNFDNKEVYKLARLGVDSSQQQHFTGYWVWKVCTLLKIRCFLWQCTHRSISVCEVLATRGLNTTKDCPLCNIAPESIIHVLRDCQAARAFWNAFSPPIQSNIFFGVNT